MLFKLSYTIRRLDIRGKQAIEICPTDLNGINLIFRSPDDKEREKGHKSYNAFLDIIGDFQPTKKSMPVFEALFEGRRPKEREKATSAEDMIEREGPEYGLDSYPNPFMEFVQNINNQLSFAGKSVTSILRWRYAQEGEPSPISSRGTFCFNEANECWVPVPSQYSVSIVSPSSSVLSSAEVDVCEIERLLCASNIEPLAHELLREAKELQYKSQRSAVLIAVSSAEVAIKSAIAEKIPDVAWLVEENQAPPIVDILVSYFPKLFSDKQLFYKPTKKEGIVKTLFDAVHIRNQMVHKGIGPPSEDKVSRILEDIEKLIWGCDYLSGHEWALINATDNHNEYL